MPEITRGFYISLLVSACILGLGGLFSRGSEVASQMTVVAALAVGFTLLNVIDRLDRRRNRHDLMVVRLGDYEFDNVFYDADGDVPYLSRGKSAPARETIPSEEGHAVRFNEAGEIIGITVVSAKWWAERDGRITATVPATTSAERRLEASADDLTAALAA